MNWTQSRRSRNHSDRSLRLQQLVSWLPVPFFVLHFGMAKGHSLSIVLVLPPAPALLVLVGRAFAIFSFWSAAARRRIAVRGPPGGVGLEGRPTLAPEAAPALAGEEGRGEDYSLHQHDFLSVATPNRRRGARGRNPDGTGARVRWP